MDLLQRYGQAAALFKARHSKTVTLAAAGLLGGLGAVAFAVAPLAPDAALLPVQTISESVTTAEIGPQLEALADHGLELSFSEVTRAGAAMDTTLRRLGIADAGTLAALRQEPALRQALEGRAGRLVQSRVGARGELLELVVRMPAESSGSAPSHFTRLSVKPAGSRFAVSSTLVPLQTQTRLASGTIRSSLFAATDEARIPDPVATQMAEIFSAEVDFHRELRKGDTFSIVYEAVTADGEPVPWNQGAGRVLAAEFINGGKTHQAIWFESGGKGAYFDPSGRSRKRAFLASPMEFSRVTSGFAMRMHPILQRMRAHLGVDYAAPTGTPVRVVGEGVVDFAGWQNGYGNVVHVRHGGDRVTVYAHLSRIDVRKGQRVEQGQHIGAVGATGWATGPHLHFEFRVGGVHQDPLKIAKASESVPLDPAARSRFTEWARTVQVKLDLAETVGSRPAFE
ncbi:MAG: peptidoglycan DD-metalloendopeptidase family protein [Betaproteobacteria bacterium]